MKKVLVLDNYDSFTYNLVHDLIDLDCEVSVYRNDEIDLDEVQKFDKILLSPGPGIPDEAGLLKKIIQKYAASKSILGVCLGQQAICEVFGGTIINLDKVHHGISTIIEIIVNDELLFEDLEKNIQVGRYHSWVVNPANFPIDLEITAIDSNSQIMALRHKIYDVKGVQFHPESILTPFGKKILYNWVNS